MTAATLLAGTLLMSGSLFSGGAQQGSQIAPALRKVLPNGTSCFTQTFSDAKQSSINIFITAAGTEDPANKHGRRHLLEHVLARSIKGLDTFLEGAGGMLLPSTTRDWMRFEVVVPTGLEEIGLDALRRILIPHKFSKEMVEREKKVIAHESALRRKDELLSASAWKAIFDDTGLDPFGEPSGLASVTPEELESTWRQMLRGNAIALVAVGDFDLDKTARALSIIGDALPSGPMYEFTERRQTTLSTRGDQLFSARIEPIDRPSGAAGIAIGLLAAFQTPDAAAYIQPSSRPSVMSIYSSRSVQKAIETVMEDPSCSDPAYLQVTFQRWLKSYEVSPSRVAELRGILLLISPGLAPTDLLNSLKQAGRSDITLAHERWKAGISL